MVGPRQAAPKQILFPNNEKTKTDTQILRYVFLVPEAYVISTQGGYSVATVLLWGSVNK